VTENHKPERRRRDFLSKIRRSTLRSVARSSNGEPRKIELDRDIIMATMFIGLLMLGGLVGFALYQQRNVRNQQKDINNNQRHIRQQNRMLSMLEKRDRINSYQTAYRFCSRINVDRAAVHALVTQLRTDQHANQRTRDFAKRYLHKLESEEGMPILDCDPNVKGGAARYWPPKQQKVFVRRWDKNELTNADIGICKIRIGTLKPPRTCE
jgi:hypothetical protein